MTATLERTRMTQWSTRPRPDGQHDVLRDGEVVHTTTPALAGAYIRLQRDLEVMGNPVSAQPGDKIEGFRPVGMVLDEGAEFDLQETRSDYPPRSRLGRLFRVSRQDLGEPWRRLVP